MKTTLIFLLASFCNCQNGIMQSNITQKFLLDLAPLMLPLTIIGIILFQLIKVCFRRQKFYEKLPSTEQQAQFEMSKKVKIPLNHKLQLFFMKYYCQMLRQFTI